MIRKEITKLKKLRSLSFFQCISIDQNAMKILKDTSILNNLSELDICECENVEAFGATVFESLTNLIFLNLQGTNIRNINGIQLLVNLTSLNLGSCEYLTDSSLFLVSSLTELKTLILKS
jgi:hypothetical protein